MRIMLSYYFGHHSKAAKPVNGVKHEIAITY